MRSIAARLLSASEGDRADRRYSPGRPADEVTTPAAVVSKGRIYLGARDTRSATAVRSATVEAISEWQATEIKNALGQKFRATVRVGLRRPWWLPTPLYLALLRSIVTESAWEQRR